MRTNRKTLGRMAGAALAVVIAAGCGGGEGGEGSATMAAGENCLGCHVDGGKASERPFTVAGTVYGSPDAAANEGVEGAQVKITDSAGKVVNLTSNSVGNFFTDESLAFPVRAELKDGGSVAVMPIAITNGGCASCHAQPPSNGAPGRVFVATP